MIDIPTEQEILAMMEEIRANPQDLRNMQYQDKYEQMTFLDLIKERKRRLATNSGFEHNENFMQYKL